MVVHAVVDASVGVNWVIDEEWSDRAELLLDTSIKGRVSLAAPPHFVVEVANVLHQRRRRRDPQFQISDDEADRALARFLSFPIQLITPTGLYQAAFTFARQYDLPSVYDSLYVVLARMLGAELWTDDQRLRRSLRDRAPWVRWIGEFEV